MDVAEVRKLVHSGQVIKAPNYHAGRRGLAFLQVLLALERCYHVDRDLRTDNGGNLLHPEGWFALANLPNRRRLRVEFDLFKDENGTLLLVVTAYET